MSWVEEIAKEAVKLAGGLGLFEALLLAVILAVALVLFRNVKLPTPPPPSPDLVEQPPSPPIPLNPDGSIPVANPPTPPDPLP